MLHYDVSAVSTAPPEAIWALLVDAESWPRWSALDAVDPELSVDLDPAGRDRVGAVRAFRKSGRVSSERITQLQEPTLFAYEAKFSPVIRDYQARIELEPIAEGTLIRWRGQYTTFWWLRWFTRRYLQGLIREMASGLAAHAGNQTPSSQPR